MPIDSILARLTQLHPKVIDLSLDRVWRLLAALGHPERSLPPVIHVAGTNGKGSTVAFLRALLEAQGKSVHAYTSPHLVRFAERIRVAGALITDAALLALLEECEAANDGAPITFFEVTTAAAFLAFSRHPADALILETGLGGRLDATNVIERPAATVITPVSIDHQSFLGTTLAQIAGEKAGIIKAGVPCVLAAQEDSAARVIEARARRLRAPLVREGTEWHVCPEAHGFTFDGQGFGMGLPFPSLAGAHQIQNAGAAIAALVASGLGAADAPAIARGVESAEWPARMQRLADHPFARLLPRGCELWLDGGHNEGAAHVIARHLSGWRDRPTHLVMGMLTTKDPEAFLRPMAPDIASLIAVPISGEPNARDPGDIAAAAQAAGIGAAGVAAGVADALRRLALDPRAARVLICGSLYLAGQVLAGEEG